MSRRASPWFREERNAWFFKVDGKQKFIAEHPADAPAPKKSAKTGLWNVPDTIREAFHKLISAPVVASGTIWEVFDDFLEWTEKNKAPRTYDFYRQRLQWFKDAQPNIPTEQLTPDEVYKWLNAHPNWSDTFKRGCITAVARAFNWGVKHQRRKVPFNPIKGIEKPADHSRDQILTKAQFQTLLRHVNDEGFRDILEILWLTGCRPQEACRVEARHVHKGFWKFSKEESKGKKRERVVFLVPKAEKLTRKWLKRNPEGPIFRNRLDRPWTSMAFSNRFADLKDVLGFKVQMYALRHSYAHHALTVSKIDPVNLATLLGHADVSMIYRVYGHLIQDTEHMKSVARKIRR